MSQLKEHLEPVATTSGREHACNFNFASAPPLTTGAGPSAGRGVGTAGNLTWERPVTAALLRVYSRGFLIILAKALPVQ